MADKDAFSRYDVYTTVGSNYCYKYTAVLKNRFQIRDAELLKKVEADIYSLKHEALLDDPMQGRFTGNYLCRLHRYLFGDVYAFAGHYRREDIMKGNTLFLTWQKIPGAIASLMEELKGEKYLAGLTEEEFIARAAYYFSSLNYIHPFREGNGRTTREFMRVLFERNGFSVSWALVEREELLTAMENAIYDPSYLVPILQKCIIRNN